MMMIKSAADSFRKKSDEKKSTLLCFFVALFNQKYYEYVQYLWIMRLKKSHKS